MRDIDLATLTEDELAERMTVLERGIMDIRSERWVRYYLGRIERGDVAVYSSRYPPDAEYMEACSRHKANLVLAQVTADLLATPKDKRFVEEHPPRRWMDRQSVPIPGLRPIPAHIVPADLTFTYDPPEGWGSDHVARTVCSVLKDGENVVGYVTGVFTRTTDDSAGALKVIVAVQAAMPAVLAVS